MFVFHSNFASSYPEWNSVSIRGWRFEDLAGRLHMPEEGVMGNPGLSGRKAWTMSDGGLVAPYHVRTDGSVPPRINVAVASAEQDGDDEAVEEPQLRSLQPRSQEARTL
jgi:hypothetical protein